MSAIELLCEVIACGSKAPANALRSRALYGQLVEHGYLRETGVVASVVCADCEQPHDAEVVNVAEQYGHFCPELGFVNLPQENIRGVAVDLPKLVERLADLFGLKRRRSKPVHGPTWRIGSMATGQGDLTVYWHPRLRDEDDAHAIEDALLREVNSSWRLIVTAEGSLPIRKAKTVRLPDLVDLDSASGNLSTAADLFALADIPVRTAAGRPDQYGEKVLALAESRVARGCSLSGRNQEALAILEEYKLKWPNEPVPSIPTVKRHLSAFRVGS